MRFRFSEDSLIPNREIVRSELATGRCELPIPDCHHSSADYLSQSAVSEFIAENLDDFPKQSTPVPFKSVPTEFITTHSVYYTPYITNGYVDPSLSNSTNISVSEYGFGEAFTYPEDISSVYSTEISPDLFENLSTEDSDIPNSEFSKTLLLEFEKATSLTNSKSSTATLLPECSMHNETSNYGKNEVLIPDGSAGTFLCSQSFTNNYEYPYLGEKDLENSENISEWNSKNFPDVHKKYPRNDKRNNEISDSRNESSFERGIPHPDSNKLFHECSFSY